MALNIVVGIPTVGRAPILCETLRELARQHRPADRVVVCGATPADLTGAADCHDGVVLLQAEAGLPRQRNAIMTAAPNADVVVFLDDDFLPHSGYLASIERHMTLAGAVAVATGTVIADGIGGPGLSPEQGRTLLAAHRIGADGAAPTFSGYGCNMAVRADLMRRHDVWFDERLPLYGWQEDVDLSRRLAAFGTVVRLGGACGVHLGVKSGRGTGVRLGYSQVANPLYLAGKRAGYPLGRAVRHLSRNIAMNALRLPFPEPYVDRRGRLVGNWLALRDLVAGRMAPERAAEL